MVVPDAALVRLSGLPKKFAFFSTHEDAAASTADPNDTGADMKRQGRVAGYVRGRNAPGAFSRRPPKGLVVMSTTVTLWRNARSAAASIKRGIADDKRLRGKDIGGARLVSFTTTKVPSLGSGAALLRYHLRPTGGVDHFSTVVVFRVGSLRGSAFVGRTDRRKADTTARQLADLLRRRITSSA